MEAPNRFQDANLRLSAFSNKTFVVCPKCSGKAIVKSIQVPEAAELRCSSCYYINSKPINIKDRDSSLTTDYYFNCKLWLQASFKNEMLWAHNYEHLAYMKQYIGAGLRERNGRGFFTLVEKLPGFVKSAKNRDRLLKIIDKLEKKLK